MKKNNWRNRFNSWRNRYDTMTYQDQQIFYYQVIRDFPQQSQHSKEEVDYFLNNIKEGRLSILEIGGWNGELAQKMLIRHPEILKWDNYEIIKDAKKSSVCKDSRYNTIIPNNFVWDIVLPNDYNILLCCHFIEHIKAKDFRKLIQNIPLSIKYIFFESPIALSSIDRDWTDDISTHILEWGWKQITEFLRTYDFNLFSLSNGVRIYKKANDL